MSRQRLHKIILNVFGDFLYEQNLTQVETHDLTIPAITYRNKALTLMFVQDRGEVEPYVQAIDSEPEWYSLTAVLAYLAGSLSFLEGEANVAKELEKRHSEVCFLFANESAVRRQEIKTWTLKANDAVLLSIKERNTRNQSDRPWWRKLL